MSQQKQPRVSVLMPVYNAEAFVGRAIDSVRAQTLEDWELVVVDDGSSDASASVIAARCAIDSRIQLHRQANRGIGGAMNQALALARAPWVAILDSDDLMYPARLARQLSFLESHPEITAVGSQFHTIDLNDTITGLDRHPVDSTDATEFMYGYFSLHHPTITARRSALLEVGGYREAPRRGCPDYRIFMELVLAGHRLANLPKILTAWRHSPEGATFGNSRQQTEDALDVRGGAFARLLKNAPGEALRIATRLAEIFPAGTELDDKARALRIGGLETPYLALLARPAGESLDPLKRAALVWLAGRETPQLPQLLEACDEPELATLARAHAGQCVAAGLPQRRADTPASAAARLRVRVRAVDLCALKPSAEEVLASIPEGSVLEILHETAPATPVASPRADLEVLHIAADAPARPSWSMGLAPGSADWVGFLEPSVTPSPAFWTHAVARLRDGIRVVHAQPEAWLTDARDISGAPIKDPTSDPRWTPDTLLGRRRTRLGHVVCAADALRDLPNWMRTIAPEISPLLAHLLLMETSSEVLTIANREWLPAVGQPAPTLAHLRRELGWWYLEGVEGVVPHPSGWERLDAGARQAVFLALDAAANQGRLRLHPGNLARVSAVFRASESPLLRRAAFRQMLATHPAQALAVLASRGRDEHLLGKLWSIGQRIRRRLSSRAAVTRKEAGS